MNFPRLALAAVLVWVVSVVIGFVVDSYLMADLYAAHASVFRPRAEMNLPLGFGGQLLGFFVFAYMYAKGYEGTSGVQEGLRFGVLVGLLLISFAVAWNYVVLPVSGSLGLAWATDALVEMAIYGIVVGWVYRPLAPAGRPGAGV
jgi:hypothetical protein